MKCKNKYLGFFTMAVGGGSWERWEEMECALEAVEQGYCWDCYSDLAERKHEDEQAAILDDMADVCV